MKTRIIQYSAIVLLCILAESLTACYTLVTLPAGIVYLSRESALVQNAKTEDYGPKPTERENALVERLVMSHKKNPGGLKLVFSRPKEGAIPQAKHSLKPVLVWVVHFSMSSEASYNKLAMDPIFDEYTFRNGKIITLRDLDGDRIYISHPD